MYRNPGQETNKLDLCNKHQVKVLAEVATIVVLGLFSLNLLVAVG